MNTDNFKEGVDITTIDSTNDTKCSSHNQYINIDQNNYASFSSSTNLEYILTGIKFEPEKYHFQHNNNSILGILLNEFKILNGRFH